MTPHDNENLTNDEQRDARLAGSFFSEPADPAVLDDPAVRARVARWHRALDVLDELEPMPATANLDRRPARGMVSAPENPNRVWRWTTSPWFRTGLAAAIMLLIGLTLVGTEIRTSNGALVIRMGPIGRSTSISPLPSEAQWVTTEQVDRLVQRGTDDRLSAFAVDLAEVISAMEQRRREEDAALVNAILQLRQSDLQQINRNMADLAVESAQQTRVTRDSITRLIEAGILPLPLTGDGAIPNQDTLY